MMREFKKQKTKTQQKAMSDAPNANPEEQKAKIEMRSGFTMLELLLVIAIIAALAGIIMFALNPADRIQEANQTKYLANAKDIEKALNSYVVDNGGNLPSTFNSLSYGYYDICKQGQSGSCVSIDELVTSGKMSTIPIDSNNQTGSTTGFKVKYDPRNKSVKVDTYAVYREWAEANGETLTEGLVGWWKMDEGSWNGTAGEVKDSSGRGNHGNAVNGTAFSPGRYGYGANTAGTEVINIPGFDELNGSSEMTISYWYYAGVSSGGPVTNWAGGTQFIVYHTTNRRINVFVSRNVGDVSTYALSEDYIVELNKWTNVQIVYDGTESTNENKLRVYVDGVEKAFVSFNNNIPSNLTTVSGQLIFGDVNTSSRYNHFDGLVDEVRIYNRILNSSELRALYNYEPEPVVFLKLDETTGSIAVDHTGNGNNGTLVNSPLWATGKYINAIVLDGIDDYIVMGNSSYTNITSNISYGGWFKTAGASDYAGLISKYNSSRNGYASGIRPSGEVFCNINLNWGAGQIGSVYSGSSLEDNLWHHHMCVYNGSVFKLYVDGILVNSSNYTDGIGNNIGQDLYLGRDSGYMSGRNFNGYIDEIKIYNYAVTQEQVVKDMNYF